MMPRFRLRFDADVSHGEEVLDFDRTDGAFVFWLSETEGGREFSLDADTRPVCRIRRSRANKDLWVIRKAD